MPHDSSAWYHLPLGDGTTAATTLDAIETAFARLDDCHKTNAAVFKRFDTSHGLHCEVTVYFSPAAAALAEKFSATTCRKPLRAGLELLVGDDTAWSR
jgi:hypothetical protein